MSNRNPSADLFLDEESADSFLDEDIGLTPTGLPSINEPTGMGEIALSGIPGGQAINMVLPGAPKAIESAIAQAPGFLKSTAQSLASPENLVPMAAGLATALAGQPELSPVAAGGASAALELAKGISPAPPAQSIQEYLTRAALEASPFTRSTGQFQIKPETPGKALGQAVMQGGLEAIPIGALKAGAGSLKGNVIPEIAQTAKELGVQPSLPQITRQSGFAKFLDFLSGGIFASNVKEGLQMKNLAIVSRAQKELAKDLSDEVTTNLGREQIGNSLREFEDVALTAQKAIEDSLYGNLDDLVGGVRQTVYEVPRGSITDFSYIPYKNRVVDETAISRTFPGNEQITETIINPTTGLEEQIVTGNRPTSITRPVTQETEREISGKVKVPQFEEPIDPATLVKVDRRVGGLEVPTTDIKRYVQGRTKITQSEPAVKLVSNILGEGRSLPFSEMQSLRSELLKISRETTDPSLQGITKGLSKVVYDSMEKSAKEAGDDVYNLWRNADEVTKAGYETFKTDFMSRLLLNDAKFPESIGEGIYKRGNVSAIKELERAAKRAEELTTEPKYRAMLEDAVRRNPEKYGNVLDKKIISKEIMDNARVGYYNNMLNDVRQLNPNYPEETFIKFGNLKNRLEDVKTKDTMEALFSKEEIAKVNKIANLGAKLEQKIPEQMIPFYRVFGTTADLMLGGGVGVAKVLQSPQAVKYLTEGLEGLAKGTRASAQTFMATMLRSIYYLTTARSIDEINSAAYDERRNK